MQKTKYSSNNEESDYNKYKNAMNDFMTETLSNDKTELFSSEENVFSSMSSYTDDDSSSINTDDIDFSQSDDFCSHANITNEKGVTICEDCGIELYEEISHEQDWRYFGDQDSRNSKDPSRCQYRKSPEKGIKKDLDRLGFPPDICELADNLYMLVTKGEIKRSGLRQGIMFSTVFEAYKIKNRPKTPDELQHKFGLDRKSMSQGITYYKLRCPREFFDCEEISAKHYIPSTMNKLSKNIKMEHVERVIKLYEKIKDACSLLNRSNPQSTSKALVYYYLRRKGCNINPIRYGKIVGLSEIIILRISAEISRVLGTQKQVNLE